MRQEYRSRSGGRSRYWVRVRVRVSGVVLLPLLGRVAFGTVEYRLSRIESVFESESGFVCASYLGAPCVFNLYDAHVYSI